MRLYKEINNMVHYANVHDLHREGVCMMLEEKSMSYVKQVLTILDNQQTMSSEEKQDCWCTMNDLPCERA